MNEFLDCFEVVWQTVNDEYFDPTFGGLDWMEVHDRYRPSNIWNNSGDSSVCSQRDLLIF